MNAIIGKITPIMIADISYGTFFFYGACCLIMGLIVYVFLPETKGRSLEEMDEVSLSLALKIPKLKLPLLCYRSFFMATQLLLNKTMVKRSQSYQLITCQLTKKILRLIMRKTNLYTHQLILFIYALFITINLRSCCPTLLRNCGKI